MSARGRLAAPVLAALGVAWSAACANQGAPPGGPVDVRPPVLIRTEPDTFGTLTDLDGPVRFHFDERISQLVTGGQLEDAITVSPQTGEVRVDHSRTSLSVELEGGFRPGIAYRVTLLPVISDMFGNRLRDPFELVFSTGGPVPTETALAGEAWDRLTGGPVRGATVQAVGPDSLRHVARADEQGIYVLRYLPEGSYVVTAFQDVDRDGTLDPREMQGSVAATLAAGDTLLLDVGILPSDTTPAVAIAADVLDSVTVSIEFDDYLEPQLSSAQIGVQLEREVGPAPEIVRVLTEDDYRAYVEGVLDSLSRLDSLEASAHQAALDSAAATTPPPVAVDSLAAPTDSAAAPAAPPTGAGAVGRAPPSRPGPPQLTGQARSPRGRDVARRRIVILLGSELEVDVPHDATVTGIVNINGIPGGGGEVTLARRAQPAATNAPPATGGGAAPTPADPPAGAAPTPTGAPSPTGAPGGGLE